MRTGDGRGGHQGRGQGGSLRAEDTEGGGQGEEEEQGSGRRGEVEEGQGTCSRTGKT